MRTYLVPASVVLLALASGCKGTARPVPQDATASCVRCHGGYDEAEPYRTGLALAAPPLSTLGSTATTDPRVGAHKQHLVDGTIRQAVECSECHVVPTQVEGHFGDPSGHATVTFGPLASAQLPAGVAPSYDPAASPGPTCSNVYCHGATLGGGANTSPDWTRVNGTQKSCNSCHGYPPPTHASFAANNECSRCHPGTVLPDNSTIDVAGGLHINGRKDVQVAGGCGGCHPFPPQNAIHATHSNPPSSTGITYGELSSGSGTTADVYDFGCGECHPTTEASHFVDAGAPGPDVDLAPPAQAIAGDDIKRRNDPSAAYDPVTRTCSGVYCHSSGQETPVYVTTPDWQNPPAGGLGCNGCHGNPPSYASGGAGTATANSHLFLDSAQWENGHFAGVPGPGHGGTRHGGGEETIAPGTGYWGANQVASPITCQACHFETVDPANIWAGRFFYFDTTGNYHLPGGDPVRLTDPEWQGAQCSYCHDNAPGSIAQAGVGKVLPAKHVNGRRDVVFDTRTAYTGNQTGVPTLPDPSALRPYYVTTATQFASYKLHPDMQYLSSTPIVLTWHLASATYDPSTKTCSNVACHMERQAMVNSYSAPPLVWGRPEAGCGDCHIY